MARFKRCCTRCGRGTNQAANARGVVICKGCREPVAFVHPRSTIPVLGTVDSATGRVEWGDEVKRIAAIAGRG